LHGSSVDAIAAALARRSIPFIFVTGYRRESLPGPFRSTTMLAKPFSEEQLLQAVTDLAQTNGKVLQLKQ
jgi:hypothetical protein